MDMKFEPTFYITDLAVLFGAMVLNRNLIGA